MDRCRREGPAQVGWQSVSVNTILVFRPVGLAKLVVLTAFDASSAQERKGRSQAGAITTIATCGVG